MALIESLSDYEHLKASSIHANQPADSRLVILQDVVNGDVMTCGARYIKGRWIGEAEKRDLTDGLTERAIWTETYLSTESSGPLGDLVRLRVI